MYLLNTIHIAKNESVNEWVKGRRIQQTIKKCHENNTISTLKSPSNSLQNAVKVGVFLMQSLTI